MASQLASQDMLRMYVAMSVVAKLGLGVSKPLFFLFIVNKTPAGFEVPTTWVSHLYSLLAVKANITFKTWWHDMTCTNYRASGNQRNPMDDLSY